MSSAKHEAPMAKLPLTSQNQTRGNAFLFRR